MCSRNTGSRAAGSAYIAVLDATLGLFQKLPAKASGILDRLKGTSPGAGRRAFPELAAWLADDALLDRFTHLCQLASVPTALTKQLKEDFGHADKAARERAHLVALPVRHARQEARLSTLLATERTLATAPRGRTKRRFAERIDELLPVAYRRELDASFREILRDAWGISVPSMTQAWRDAVRSWLVVDDNRDLLGRLLREVAAPTGGSRSVKLSFVKNREWIAKVQGRIDVAAWLAPRRAEIDVEGTRYDVALEEDPLEVLRMGIPFATCLALDNGSNAASTVPNAVDANKRVLYVRSRDGKVVARKLIAITKELRIVGYNLYVAARGPVEIAIRSAVAQLCRELAADVRAPLAGTGEPDKLHDGFWYDDGTVPWGEDFDVVSYCRALGLGAPPDASARGAGRRGRAAQAAPRAEHLGLSPLRSADRPALVGGRAAQRARAEHLRRLDGARHGLRAPGGGAGSTGRRGRPLRGVGARGHRGELRVDRGRDGDVRPAAHGDPRGGDVRNAAARGHALRGAARRSLGVALRQGGGAPTPRSGGGASRCRGQAPLPRRTGRRAESLAPRDAHARVEAGRPKHRRRGVRALRTS